MKWKKAMCVLLAAVAASFGVGCGTKVDDSDKTLEIAYLDAGYGYSFVTEMGKAFEKTHPDIDVVLSKSSDITPRVLITAGPTGNSVDLFITGADFNGMAKEGANVLKGYDCVMEPIDEVMETEIDGKKIKDRFESGYEPTKINGHYYSFSWARGMTGLVYNKTIFEQKGYAVPNTTKQLADLCEDIKGNGQIPFVFSSSTGYWSYIRNIWYMQYQGKQGMYDMFACIDNNAYSKDVLLQKGRLVSLQTLENLIGDAKGNNHGSVNTLSFTAAQARFIGGEGLMTVNGDWLENEMKAVASEDANRYTFEMLKTPVVSEIIELTPTINDDATLDKVIKYIDGDAEKSTIEGVSDEDIARIREARNCRYTLAFNHSVGIPVYATAKEAAIEFLKFMATDEAQQIYLRETNGNFMPFAYDMETHPETWNAMSDYSKSMYSLSKDAIYFGGDERKVSGFSEWNGGRENPELFFTAKNPSDRKTAQQIYQEEYDWWTAERWNHLLQNAGIL